MGVPGYSCAIAVFGFFAAGAWWHIVVSIPWSNPSGLADILLQFFFDASPASNCHTRRTPRPEVIK
jgi:hypothetical protein